MIIDVNTDVLKQVGSNPAIVLATIRALANQDLVENEMWDGKRWILVSGAELSEATGLSVGTAYNCIRKLQEEGLLSKEQIHKKYRNFANWYCIGS